LRRRPSSSTCPRSPRQATCFFTVFPPFIFSVRGSSPVPTRATSRLPFHLSRTNYGVEVYCFFFFIFSSQAFFYHCSLIQGPGPLVRAPICPTTKPLWTWIAMSSCSLGSGLPSPRRAAPFRFFFRWPSRFPGFSPSEARGTCNSRPFSPQLSSLLNGLFSAASSFRELGGRFGGFSPTGPQM